MQNQTQNIGANGVSPEAAGGVKVQELLLLQLFISPKGGRTFFCFFTITIYMNIMV
jgi:hypothetical protein